MAGQAFDVAHMLAGGLVLVADHARNSLPEEYGDLGLPADEFQRHIAYDIGVEGVTRRLAALTGAPAIMASYSRLLIDPNRGEDDPTLIRKGVEAYFTILIETLWSKQRILEMYLNIAEFGRGTYGVGAASRHFYGKTAARLTPAEGALLAAVLPNPLRFSVHSPSAYVRQRQNWILWQMRALGGRSYLLAFESGK